MPRTPNISDNWSIDTEQTKLGTMITATHDDDDVDIVVKEYPNGVAVRLQKPANLPGGYDVVHDVEFGSVDVAIDELEDYAAEYDEAGDWNTQEPPVIQ